MNSSKRNSSGPAISMTPFAGRPLADLAHGSGDVVRCDRLDQHMREPHRVTVRGRVGDALDELEELGRMDDRVGDRAVPDQLLLRDLRPEVAALGQALGADD